MNTKTYTSYAGLYADVNKDTVVVMLKDKNKFRVCCSTCAAGNKCKS